MTTTEATLRCRVTTYTLLIKTQPRGGWSAPGGWGPYFTAADAEAARKRADGLWMAARGRAVRGVCRTDARADPRPARTRAACGGARTGTCELAEGGGVMTHDEIVREAQGDAARESAAMSLEVV